MPGAHRCFPCRGLCTFPTREELIVHSDRASHPYCKVCQKYVRTAADFEWHLLKVHGSRARNTKNYCVVCDMEIARTRNFREHRGSGEHQFHLRRLCPGLPLGLSAVKTEKPTTTPNFCMDCSEQFKDAIELNQHCLNSVHHSLYKKFISKSTLPHTTVRVQ